RQSGKAARPVIFATWPRAGHRFEVPTSRKEAIAGSRDDATAQRGIIAIGDQRKPQGLAEAVINGIGFGTIQSQCQQGTGTLNVQAIFHRDASSNALHEVTNTAKIAGPAAVSELASDFLQCLMHPIITNLRQQCIDFSLHLRPRDFGWEIAHGGRSLDTPWLLLQVGQKGGDIDRWCFGYPIVDVLLDFRWRQESPVKVVSLVQGAGW
ncbi:MAG TPA: hypothetical protein VF920_17050, partial [Dongiaceae bacterium]